MTTEEELLEVEGVLPRPGASHNARKAKRTVTTRQEFIDDPTEKKDVSFSALFDDGDEEGKERTVRVRVYRKEPDEGMLGYIEDMNATEQAILDRWGGGSLYRLEGCSSVGRVLHVRTIRMAGEPIFMSEAAEAQWRKQKGLPPKWLQQQGQLNTTDLLKLMDEREEKRQKAEEERRREDRERQEARAREDREAQESRRREEREWKAEQSRLERDYEDKRRRDDEERDRRRRQEEQEAETRRMAAVSQQQQQQQQFMQSMLQMTQQQAQQALAVMRETSGSKSDPTDALLKGVQLVMQIKESVGDSGGEEDLLTTVVKGLPAMLNGIGNATQKVVREFRGTSGESAQGGEQQQAGALTLPPGKVSEKFTAIINRVVAAGGDPERVLDTVADRLLAVPSAPQKPTIGPQATTTPTSTPSTLPVIGGAGGIPPEVVAQSAAQLSASTTSGAEQPKTNAVRLKFTKGTTPT